MPYRAKGQRPRADRDAAKDSAAENRAAAAGRPDTQLEQATHQSDAPDTPAAARSEIVHYAIKAGDTLEGIFISQDLPLHTLYSILDTDEPYLAIDVLQPGDELTFELDSDKQLQKLSLAIDPSKTVAYLRNSDNSFKYEETNIPFGMPRVDAARINVHQRQFTAFLFSDGHYYDDSGESLTPALRRYPFSGHHRVSFPFNPRRLRPITHRITPHNGVDLAAPIGTPVLSTGDGIVTRVARHRYAGNYNSTLITQNSKKLLATDSRTENSG